MALNLKTPGVYIKEVNAFPNSVVQVGTAVPAFIGYTEKADRNGKSLLKQPTRITSMAEFTALFGGPMQTKFKVAPAKDASEPGAFIIHGSPKKVEDAANTTSLFHHAMRLFYANGGGACYVISVGLFQKDSKSGAVTVTPNVTDLAAGIPKLEKEFEPTMIVVPEAVKLAEADCYSIYQKAMAHCEESQSRITIMDIHGGSSERNAKGDSVIEKFRGAGGVGKNHLSYGVAYYPWLETNIVAGTEMSVSQIENLPDVQKMLEEAVKAGVKEVTQELEILKVYLDKKTPAEDLEGLNKALLANGPTIKAILKEARSIVNQLPPSAAMAGIYTMVDNTRGVWKAPANVSLASVVAPSINISHDEQEALNVDGLGGKSVNAIRVFPGEGTLVWGARTLDGNSQDWRYINVRRTMIMIEQSLKNAAKAYVFEPNDAKTWSSMKAMIDNYLTGLWKQGALVGSTPSEAFQVLVGLGSTMTSTDILDGIMRISVKLALSRPAEFIVLSFQQMMQEGGAGGEG